MKFQTTNMGYGALPRLRRARDLTVALAVGLGVVAFAGPLTVETVHAADEAATEKKAPAVAVEFEKPGEPVQLEGTLSGYEVRHYRVSAHSGQTLSVDLSAENAMIYFNIFSPDGGVFFGSETTPDHNHFSGKVPADGGYVIEVYLVRGRARQIKDAPYKLSVTLKS